MRNIASCGGCYADTLHPTPYLNRALMLCACIATLLASQASFLLLPVGLSLS